MQSRAVYPNLMSLHSLCFGGVAQECWLKDLELQDVRNFGTHEAIFNFYFMVFKRLGSHVLTAV